MTAEETRLVESAYRAKAPWYDFSLSYETEHKNYLNVPQQEIDFCLSCPYSEASCDRCNGMGKIADDTNRGRPKIEIDGATIREMLRLRMCKKDICKNLNISDRTYYRKLKGE